MRCNVMILGVVVATTILFSALVQPCRSAVVSWTGTGGSSWATASSWSNGSGPGTTDTANFTNTGSVTLPGTVTSIVNANRTIGGLAFSNTSGDYQTVDLGGFTLTVAGNLNFNTDQGSTSTTTLRDGNLVVNGSSNLLVGTSVSESASGSADLSRLTSFNATLQDLYVGFSTTGSSSAGTLTLAPTNTITASVVSVGSDPSGNDNGTAALTLGMANTLLTGQLTIAQNNSGGTVTLPAGGSLALGSAASPTAVSIASASTNSAYQNFGILDCSQGAFTGYLSSLTVAQQIGTNGAMVGTFNAGNSGTITIGAAGTNTANIIVANATDGGTGVSGTVNLGGLASLNANLNTFTIGTGANNGIATGTVTLAASNSVNASSITIGSSTGVNGSGLSTLTLGASNTIVTGQLSIGLGIASGEMTLPAGGTLTLGSPTKLTAVVIESENENTSDQETGLLDLSHGSFTGYLSSLTVAQQIGTNGNLAGTFNAGDSGSVLIGATGTSTANIIVANSTNGASGITGIVNFGGLNSLVANLNTFTIGTANGVNSTQGTVTLAASNVIAANSITVGDNGNENDTLALGYSNTILTSQLTIGQDYSTGTVTIASGGSLVLGSPTAPVNLNIGVGTTNTNNTYGGSLVLSNSTVKAYFGNVVLGNKNAQPGAETATLTFSSSANNYIVASSIALGGNESTGILNFAGGILYAGSITAGTGTANFNWTGGTLAVGAFGTVAIPFNLSNTGTGTLAPGTTGSIVGTTTIFGNYTQGAAATTAFDITGISPGSGYDQVNISGTAKLAGTISLNITNAFTPAVGDVFELETYASETGSYANIIPPALPAGVAFQLDYSNPTQLLLELVAPTTQTYNPPGPFSTFNTASNWSPQGLPGTSTSAFIVNSGSTSETVTMSASDTLYRLDLQGTVGKADLEITNGVTLATTNQVIVDTGATMDIQNGGVVVANGGLAGAGATNVEAGGSLTTMLLHQSSLTIGGTVKVVVASPHSSSSTLSVLGALILAGSTDNWTGSLDLGDSDLDLQNGSLATITDQIKQGYKGGTWTGPGITSSAAAGNPAHLTALGVIQNNQGGASLYTFIHPFDGTTPGASDILVKYTYYGDANLDGKVDGSDYSRIDNAYLADQTDPSEYTGWYNGDFNYDGVTDGSDYTLIDNAFNTQSASLASSIAGPSAAVTAEIGAQSTEVPEPATMASVAVVWFAAMAMRQRRSVDARPALI